MAHNQATYVRSPPTVRPVSSTDVGRQAGRGRVGPLAELRIVAAQLDGTHRRLDDLESLRTRLIQQARKDGCSIDQIARATRLPTEKIDDRTHEG